MNTNKFAYDVPGLSLTLLANKNMKGFRFVKTVAGILEYCADGDDAIGVLREFIEHYPREVDNDEYGAQVTISGVLRVEAGEVIAENDAIYAGADGVARKGKASETGVKIGIALTPAKKGGLVSVLIR